MAGGDKPKGIWSLLRFGFSMRAEDALAFMSPGHLYFAVVVGWIVEAGYCFASQPSISDGFRAFFIVWFASAGGFFFGASLGFLFGFPRARQEANRNSANYIEGPKDSAKGRLADNTNLEDISDWLTKIIIGIGIAQFGALLKVIGDIGNFVAIGMGGDNLIPGNTVIAISSMSYGAVCGFIFYYYWARVALFRLFQTLEISPEQRT